jgi:hypothetical protein
MSMQSCYFNLHIIACYLYVQTGIKNYEFKKYGEKSQLKEENIWLAVFILFRKFLKCQLHYVDIKQQDAECNYRPHVSN